VKSRIGFIFTQLFVKNAGPALKSVLKQQFLTHKAIAALLPKAGSKAKKPI
jgi:hypothetical protein